MNKASRLSFFVQSQPAEGRFKSADERRKILRKLREDGIIETVSDTYGIDTTYRLARSVSKN